MTMTDPIADMLTRIRNANVAMHDTVKMPGSKLKLSLPKNDARTLAAAELMTAWAPG